MNDFFSWYNGLPISNQIALIVAGITLFGVVLTIASNIFIGRFNIKANVISKARIEWIQKERDYLSQYISLASNMNSYYEAWKDQKKEPDWFFKHSEHPTQFQNIKNLLVLSLGPDDGTEPYNNQDFIILIVDLYDTTEKRIKTAICQDVLEKKQQFLI